MHLPLSFTPKILKPDFNHFSEKNWKKLAILEPNKQTGNSFLKKTIKHIDPNKTHRQGKKAKKE